MEFVRLDACWAQVMDPVPIKDLASYGMWDVTHGARVAIGLVVKRLLEAGANPNAKDDGGKTPLHYAAVGGLEVRALRRCCCKARGGACPVFRL